MTDYSKLNDDELREQIEAQRAFLEEVGQMVGIFTDEVGIDLAKNKDWAGEFGETSGRLVPLLQGFAFYDTGEQDGKRVVKVYYDPELVSALLPVIDGEGEPSDEISWESFFEDDLVLEIRYLYGQNLPALPNMEPNPNPRIDRVLHFDKSDEDEEDYWVDALKQLVGEPAQAVIDDVRSTLKRHRQSEAERLAERARRLDLEEQAARLAV